VKYLVQLCVLRKEEDMKINNNFIIRLPCDSIEIATSSVHPAMGRLLQGEADHLAYSLPACIRPLITPWWESGDAV
jgi:hypothetical protein